MKLSDVGDAETVTAAETVRVIGKVCVVEPAVTLRVQLDVPAVVRLVVLTLMKKLCGVVPDVTLGLSALQAPPPPMLAVNATPVGVLASVSGTGLGAAPPT